MARHETWLKLGLGLTATTVLALAAALTVNLGWSSLAVLTLLFVLCYPLVWLSYRVYRFWTDSLMELTSYVQVAREGSGNIQFKRQHSGNLLFELQQEIGKLAKTSSQKARDRQTLEQALGSIMDSWNMPIALFGDSLALNYCNPSMASLLGIPMLAGSKASEMGFKFDNARLDHPLFDSHWQCQTIEYHLQDQVHFLFWAVDISAPLRRNQSISQNNLVRVLGHELRNSLTPMASMADTLLESESIPQEQARLVLERVQKRANRLLGFIEQYAKLNQLPPPSPKWFNLAPLIQEAKTMMPSPVEVEMAGESQCFGDPVQLSQVFINLMKNTVEADSTQAGNIPRVNIRAYRRDNWQIIEFCDSGPGFANLENVLTPFYTTKPQGSGIGLALCAEILARHHGQLNVYNCQAGAKIELLLPHAR